MKIDNVIVLPILTEKATSLAAKKVYMFEVDKGASKTQIRSVLEKLYKVVVGKITIVNRTGKTRRVGKKMKIKQLPKRKIAYITVTSGKIDLFPQA